MLIVTTCTGDDSDVIISNKIITDFSGGSDVYIHFGIDGKDIITSEMGKQNSTIGNYVRDVNTRKNIYDICASVK